MPPNTRLRRAARTVGTLALALLIAPPAAHADFASEWGADACPLPTEDQCNNSHYAATWCGAQAAAHAQCDAYEYARFEAAWYASPYPSGVAIMPKGMENAGARVNAKLIPAAPPVDATVPSSIHYLSTIRADELALASVPGTHASMAWAERIAPRHPHGEDFRARTCEGYVYKRWYEYSRFEDAARTCGADAMCVFQVGRTTTLPGITGPLRQLAPASPYLPTIPGELRPRSQDPSPEPGAMAPLPYRAKNAFFRVSPRAILWASTQFASNADFANDSVDLVAAAGTPPLYDTSDRMQWHVTMEEKQRPLGLDRAERKDIARRLAAYDRLVDEYQRLRPGAASMGWGTIAVNPTGTLDRVGLLSPLGAETVLGMGTDWMSMVDYLGAADSWDGGADAPAPDSMSPDALAGIALQAVIDEMAELLMSEWRQFHKTEGDRWGRGCLKGVACDWQPELFRDDYVGRFLAEREADLLACHDATEPRFDFTTWEMTDPLADPDGPGADVIKLAAFIDAKREENRMRAAGLPWSTDGHGATGSRNIRWGIPPVKESHGVESLLHARYEHHATADLALKFGTSGICNVSAGVDAGIYAEYTAPRREMPYLPETHVMVDGDLEVKVNRDGKAFYASSHLYVAEQEIFKLDPIDIVPGEGRWAPAPVGRHFPIYDYQLQFSILGVPAYLAVKVQGEVALTPEFHVPPYVENCAGALAMDAPIMPTVEGSIAASVDIDADGEVGLGIPGVVAVGVAGHVDVLSATLPATASFKVINRNGQPYLSLGVGAHLEAALFGGTISVYAQALVLRAEQEILGWPAMKVKLPLWKERFDLPLADVIGEFKVTP